MTKGSNISAKVSPAGCWLSMLDHSATTIGPYGHHGGRPRICWNWNCGSKMWEVHGENFHGRRCCWMMLDRLARLENIFLLSYIASKLNQIWTRSKAPKSGRRRIFPSYSKWISNTNSLRREPSFRAHALTFLNVFDQSDSALIPKITSWSSHVMFKKLILFAEIPTVQLSRAINFNLNYSKS